MPLSNNRNQEKEEFSSFFQSKFNQILSSLPLSLWEGPLGLGFSGGSDSVCLALALLGSSFFSQEKLILIHCNHGVRDPKVHLAEENWVKKFADNHGLTLKVIKLHPKKTDENSLRKLRLSAFEQSVQEMGLKGFFLAHHWNDHLETIQQQSLRGRGPLGLQGIRIIRNTYIRPFLDFSKSDILNFLKSKEQDFVTDPSNADLRYQRNALRAFQKELPTRDRLALGALGVLSHWMQEWQVERTRFLKSFLMRSSYGIEISRTTLDALSPTLVKYLLAMAANEMGLPGPFSRGFLNEVLGQIEENQRGLIQGKGLLIKWNSDTIFLGARVVKQCNFGYFIKVRQSSDLEKIPGLSFCPKALQVQLEKRVLDGQALTIRTLSGESFKRVIFGKTTINRWFQDNRIPVNLRISFLGVFSQGVFLGLFSSMTESFFIEDFPSTK